MKKALVVAMVMVLGLGALAFGQLTGTFEGTISFDPGATVFTDLVAFSSGLTVDYTIAGWTFESITGFSNDGFDAQSFKADGVVGAFTFSSTMNFLPMAIAASGESVLYGGTYVFASAVWPGLVTVTSTVTTSANVAATPEFDDWTVEGSVSIAGMKFEALFFMEDWAGTLESTTTHTYYTAVSTDALLQSGSFTVTNAADLLLTGAGWRFKAAGSFGDVSLTSYTYFNLIEGFSETDSAMSLARDGDFEMAFADQVVRFTEQYVTLEGMSIGCVTFDAALRVTCANGFEDLVFWVKDIYLMCCGISTDFVIDFEVDAKKVSLFPTITTDWACIEPTIELDLSADKHIINGFKLTGLAAEFVLGGVTFSSSTLFEGFGTVDSGGTEDTYILVPAVTPAGIGAIAGIPSVDVDGNGYYMIHEISFADDYYETFEDFTITVEGDGCCGGAYEISLQTWFGNHYTETLKEFGYWYETNINVVGGTVLSTTDHGQGLFWDVENNYGPVPALPAVGTWYVYDAITAWFPGCGTVPGVVDIEDVAYSTLIGLGGTPTDYGLVPVATETLTSNYDTTKTAEDGSIFGWAKSTVAVEMGIGSNFTLTGGFSIDAYGWNSVDFGFEFTF